MKPSNDAPTTQNSSRNAKGVGVWLLLGLVMMVVLSILITKFASLEAGSITGAMILVIVIGALMVNRRQSHEQSFDSKHNASNAVDRARPLLRPAIPLLKRGRLYAKTMKDKAELAGSTTGRTGYLDTMHAEHVQEAQRHERYQAGTQKASDLARQMKLRKTRLGTAQPLRKAPQIGTDVMPTIPTVQDITSPTDRRRAGRKI